MPDVSDMDLLQDYSRQGSEEAFAGLVRRHISLVYSAAFRHVGNAAQAEEITQAVFVILARKAGSLRPHTVLEGWFYETTRLTCLNFLRGERRRRSREQEAYMQSTLQESGETSVWDQVAPLLDEAMARLGKKDRDAVVLRFFKEKSLGEVAVALRISEAAAQSRVHRVVEKLRRFFHQRGVVLTAAAIAGTISANSVQAAPVALAKTVTAVAIVKGTAASASTLTLVKGALKVMAWTKAQTAVVGVVIIGLATYSVIQHQTQSKLRGQNELLQQQIAQLSQLKVENQNLSNQLAQANRSETGTRNKPNDPVPQLPPVQPTNQVQVAAVPPHEPVPQTASATTVELPKTSWTNAGFATPKAVLQSRGAAVLNGNRDLFKQSVFITDDARKLAEDTLVKMVEASNDPNKAQYIQDIVNNNLGAEEAILMPMMALNQNNSLTGYKIISQQSLSDNEMILQMETDTVSTPPRTETLDFQRFGNNWKIVYDQAAIQRMMQQ